MPDELEDDDLLAELDDLEEEIENEPITDEVPDYLISANSATNTNTNINTNTNANANQVSADPYALPDVPARNIQI